MKKPKKIAISAIGLLLLIVAFFLIVQLEDNKKNIATGNPFYFADLYNETMLLSAANKEDKSSLYLLFLEERISELEKVENDQILIGKTTTVFNRYASSANRIIGKQEESVKDRNYKRLIGIIFKYVSILSKYDFFEVRTISDELNNSMNGLAPRKEELANVVAENSGSISATSEQMIEKVTESLPEEMAAVIKNEKVDAVKDAAKDKKETNPPADVITDGFPLTGLSISDFAILTRGQVNNSEEVEFVNVLKNRNIFAVFALKDLRDPNYAEVAEENLLFVFTYNPADGKSNMVGQYFSESYNALDELKTVQAILDLNLPTDELDWLLGNYPSDKGISYWPKQ